MKKIKFSLAAIAITVGIGGAFAFTSTPTPVKSGQSTGEYYTSDGVTPGLPVDPAHKCLNENSTICSATFVVISGQPQPGTASNPRTGLRQ
uniref:DUF6520 family protein n=1 Tax=Pedobacter schmidteae TaxID=2201271 RepID=UPI000EAEEE44|nr:DUF6520 family protein [Pedobacter schmidteae]